MGKFERKRTKKSRLPVFLIAVVCILVICTLCVGLYLGASDGEDSNLPGGDSQSTGDVQSTGDTQETGDPQGAGESTQPSQQEQTQPLVSFPVKLENLTVQRVGEYSGIYMEDGSDEVVSGVMMLILQNQSEEDLQLARINVKYSGFTAEFEATNIPAGESVVLLEKNRAAMPQEEILSVSLRNVVFFQERMSLMADVLEITGNNGMLKVTNISDEDIAGDILVYYKNSAVDLLYGGITYRVRIQGGLAAGETAQIISNHYTPDTCRLVMVTCAQE